MQKNLADASGTPNIVQASTSGDEVTYFSATPFPSVLGSSEFVTYIGARRSEGWKTTGLLPLSDPGWHDKLSAVTEDFSKSVVIAGEPLTRETPGAAPGIYNYYVEDNSAGTFQLLFAGPQEITFADASAHGSRILFNSYAPEGRPSLYLWEHGTKRLIAAGAIAGNLGSLKFTNKGELYTQNTLSSDGSRIFYTAYDKGPVYMTEPESGRTIQISAAGEAEWLAATPNGNFAFYSEGGRLYRYNLAHFNSKDEEAARELLANGPIAGILGTSEDGAYVYYVAGADIYLWHAGSDAGTTAIVATASEPRDWTTFRGNSEPVNKQSRVTPTGQDLLFSSVVPLGSAQNPKKLAQLYRYDAPTGTLVCVSCNPSGAPAAYPALLEGANLHSGPSARNPFLTHNLSTDGNRVFFQTEEALLPQDTDNAPDVYEWDSGHLSLISTGKDPSGSFFGDAGLDGSDVYFFTRQSLVTQDQDQNFDLYDARINGGFLTQNSLPAEPCQQCRPPASAPPAFSAPYSAIFTGPGNPASSQPQPRPKPLTRAQRLAAALRACHTKPKRRRSACEAKARRTYDKAARRSSRHGRMAA